MINWKSKLLLFVKHFYIYIFLALIYIPMVLIIILSFTGQTSRGNINYGLEGDGSFENYPELFSNNAFTNALAGSLLLGVVTTPVVVIIATITCFGIWRSATLQKQSVLLSSNLTIASPDAITGISLMLLFTSTIVPLGVDLGFFTVILAHISFGVPYAIIAIYPRMTKLNPNTVLASYDLGSGKIRTFFKVVVPFLLPGIISGAIIAFAMSLDDYVITNLVNGSYQTIGTAIYSTRKGIKAWVVTFGAIMVMITFVIILVKSVFIYFKSKKNAAKKITNAMEGSL
ncbi:MAG: ABC transporter permease [Mycoplasmataceae bacterium]|nr:ABC transporter permease [Mycoplasmataceae bacterium]